MLRKIKRDAKTLRFTISTLSNESASVEQNGKLLRGAKLEAEISQTKASLQANLDYLESIIRSGKLPDEYTSMVTKKTYSFTKKLQLKETQSLPQAKYSFFGIKEKKNPDALKGSQIKLIRDNGNQITSFFMENKKNHDYPKGAFAAKVKKGSLSEGDIDPKYAIKVYRKNVFNGDKNHELRIAMRAAYCYRQLGREGYSFRRNDKQYLVTEWFGKVSLDNTIAKEVLSMPIPRRIIMAITLLRELNVLHKQGLIHHDIKPGNVRLDYGKSAFVDLDSVSPKNEKPICGISPMFTLSFLPNAQMAYDATHSNEAYLLFNENTDIHALGITFMHLFIEIYMPKLVNLTINISNDPAKSFHYSTFALEHGPKYSEHPEMQKVLKNMVVQENVKLASCEDYIAKLLEILKTYPLHEQYLTEDRLANLCKNGATGDGKKAFKEIEIELLGYDQRFESARKLTM